jgi:hypothetical protein
MRNIVVYVNKNDNLCSIKPVEHDFSGYNYLIKLLEYLSDNLNSIIYVNVSKPYYETQELVNRLKSFQEILFELYISDDLFEISFYVSKSNLSCDIIKLLTDIWFEYEQPFFILTSSEVSNADILNLINNRRTKWYHVTSCINAYVMYKEVEQDVVWIGKSSDLNFKYI